MKFPCVWLCVLAAAVSGCDKKETAAVPETNAITSTTAAPSTSPESVTTAAASATAAELTQLVRRYALDHRRMPKSLDELVSAGYLKSIPEAPPGKKFALDVHKAEVALANK